MKNRLLMHTHECWSDRATSLDDPNPVLLLRTPPWCHQLPLHGTVRPAPCRLHRIFELPQASSPVPRAVRSIQIPSLISSLRCLPPVHRRTPTGVLRGRSSQCMSVWIWSQYKEDSGTGNKSGAQVACRSQPNVRLMRTTGHWRRIKVRVGSGCAASTGSVLNMEKEGSAATVELVGGRLQGRPAPVACTQQLLDSRWLRPYITAPRLINS